MSRNHTATPCAMAREMSSNRVAGVSMVPVILIPADGDLFVAVRHPDALLLSSSVSSGSIEHSGR